MFKHSVTFCYTVEVYADNEEKAKDTAKQEFGAWLSENAHPSDFTATAVEVSAPEWCDCEHEGDWDGGNGCHCMDFCAHCTLDEEECECSWKVWPSTTEEQA